MLFRILAATGLAATVLLAALSYTSPKSKRCEPAGAMRFKWPAAFVSSATIACVVALAATGFAASLWWRRPLAGEALLVHAGAGAALVPLLGLVALLRCEDYAHRGFSATRRFFFWAFLAAATFAFFAILPDLMPCFSAGTIGIFCEVHRWCALVATMAFLGLGLGR